jgi:hypothetical protein
MITGTVNKSVLSIFPLIPFLVKPLINLISTAQPLNLNISAKANQRMKELIFNNILIYIDNFRQFLDELSKLGTSDLLLAKANDYRGEGIDGSGKILSDDNISSDNESKKPLNKGKGKATEGNDYESDGDEKERDLLESNRKRKANEISDTLAEQDQKLLKDLQSKHTDINSGEGYNDDPYRVAEIRSRKMRDDLEERINELAADKKNPENKDKLDNCERVLNLIDKQQFERDQEERELPDWTITNYSSDMDYSPANSPTVCPASPISPGEGPSGTTSSTPPLSPTSSASPDSPVLPSLPRERASTSDLDEASSTWKGLYTQAQMDSIDRWCDDLEARLERQQAAIIEQEGRESRGWFWHNGHQVPPLPKPDWDDKPKTSSTSNDEDKTKNSTSSATENTELVSNSNSNTPAITVTLPTDSNNIPAITVTPPTDTPTVNNTLESSGTSRRNGRSGGEGNDTSGGIDTSGGSNTPTETGTSEITDTSKIMDILTETNIPGTVGTVDLSNSDECLEGSTDESNIGGFKHRIKKLVFENSVKKLLDSILNTPINLPSWNPPNKPVESPIDYVVELMECDPTCYIWDDAD